MFVRDVRLQIALTLGLISIISLVRFFSLESLLALIITILTGQLLEGFLSYLTKKKYFFSYSALVSTLLVLLLFDQNLPLWIYLSAISIAITSKYILKFNNRHIFNPAALGIFLTSILAGQPVAWWGTSWHWLLVVALYIGAVPVLRRLRRLYIVGGFLLVYFLFALYATKSLQTIQLLWDGTTMLFALVMLPEPQTSPVVGHWIKTFGIFVGIIMIILIKILPTMNIDSLLLSLLTADLLSFILINLKSSPKIVPVPTTNV